MTVTPEELQVAQTNLLAGGFAPHPLDTLMLRGKDAAVFLHNLCTADIKSLKAGQGCELFVTDVKGKTLGYGWAICTAQSDAESEFHLLTAPQQAAIVLAHMDKYHITEKVTLTDASDAWAHFSLVNLPSATLPSASSPLTVAGSQLAQRYQHTEVSLGDVAARLLRTDYAGEPSYLLTVPQDQAETFAAELTQLGLQAGNETALESLRIAAGTPVFGRDITAANLPQEINRDALAISFKKGCYLGQETVARLDALGHVNKLLVQLESDSPLPAALPSPLTKDGKEVGQLTSAAWNYAQNKAVGLGVVRRGSHTAATELDGGVRVVG